MRSTFPTCESIGLKLVGGRLLPGPTGEAAAFYMYEGQSGERFTIYCAKAKAPETALRFKGDDRFAAFYWVDDKHRLCGERPGRPRPARAGHQDGLRAGGQERREEVVSSRERHSISLRGS